MRPGLARTLAPVVVACALFAGAGSLLAESAFAPPATAAAFAAAPSAESDCGGIVYTLLGRCGVWESQAA